MAKKITAESDAEIIALVMEHDMDGPEHPAYIEARRRWGSESMERTAAYCTGGKFDPAEVAEQVRQQPRAAKTWVAVAKGEQAL